MKDWQIGLILMFVICVSFFIYKKVECHPAKVISIGGCDKSGYCGVLLRDEFGNEDSRWMSYPVVGEKTSVCVAKEQP